MGNLVTDVKNLELETLKNLKSSKAANTLRAYEADYKDFGRFCIKHGFKSMPTEPKIVALYLTLLSQTSKFSTLKRRLASISVIHRLSGHYIDTKHPMITENLMGIKRVKGSYQKAKKPILINELKSIVNVIDKDQNEKRRAKNRALILVGFAGGFRRSELVAIHYEDIDFVSEGVKIFVKRSKTDQFGEGMVKGLPYFSNQNYCPVLHLKKWLELSNIKSGSLFRRFTKGSKLTNKRLTDQTVALLLKKYLNSAGIDNENYSGHSLRSGFATSAAESGAEERNIMAMTGHKTTQMVRRYIKEANLFKNNALNNIKI